MDKSGKFIAQGVMVDWRPDHMQFVMKDSTQHWFSGEEYILIHTPSMLGSKFIDHVRKFFGNDLSKLKIEIILHR